MAVYPPYVIERTSRGERSYDIFSRLLMDRIVFLGSAIDDNVANIIVAQLLFLDADDPERDIYHVRELARWISVYFRSRDLRHDPVRVRAPVATLLRRAWLQAWERCFWLQAGAKGKRARACLNSRIMIHQPWGGAQGTATDIQIAGPRDAVPAEASVSMSILGAPHCGKSTRRLWLRTMWISDSLHESAVGSQWSTVWWTWSWIRKNGRVEWYPAPMKEGLLTAALAGRLACVLL